MFFLNICWCAVWFFGCKICAMARTKVGKHWFTHLSDLYTPEILSIIEAMGNNKGIVHFICWKDLFWCCDWLSKVSNHAFLHFFFLLQSSLIFYEQRAASKTFLSSFHADVWVLFSVLELEAHLARGSTRKYLLRCSVRTSRGASSTRPSSTFCFCQKVLLTCRKARCPYLLPW